MKGKRFVVPLLGAVGLMALPVAAQADGLTMANPCAGCHGTDGVSPGSMPGIGGKKASWIKQTMMEFKAGSKEHTVMQRIAKGYTDEQIDALAKALGTKD